MNYFTKFSFTLYKKCKYCFNEFEYDERDVYYVWNQERMHKVTCKYDLCRREIDVSRNEIPEVTRQRMDDDIDHYRFYVYDCDRCGKKRHLVTGREYASTISIKDVSSCCGISRSDNDIYYNCHACKRRKRSGELRFVSPRLIADEVRRNHDES